MGLLGRHWRIALLLLIVKTNLFFSSEPPNLLPLNFGQEVMDEGSFAQVSCIVTKGDQPLTISWSFHGHDISSDLGIITTPLGKMGSSLMITSVGHKHRGTFTCKASNQAGNTTQSVELKVNGTWSSCWCFCVSFFHLLCFYFSHYLILYFLVFLCFISHPPYFPVFLCFTSPSPLFYYVSVFQVSPAFAFLRN